MSASRAAFVQFLDGLAVNITHGATVLIPKYTRQQQPALRSAVHDVWLGASMQGFPGTRFGEYPMSFPHDQTRSAIASAAGVEAASESSET